MKVKNLTFWLACHRFNLSLRTLHEKMFSPREYKFRKTLVSSPLVYKLYSHQAKGKMKNFLCFILLSLLISVSVNRPLANTVLIQHSVPINFMEQHRPWFSYQTQDWGKGAVGYLVRVPTHPSLSFPSFHPSPRQEQDRLYPTPSFHPPLTDTSESLAY